MFRSAALLLGQCSVDFDRFGGDSDLPHEISPWMPLPELYRMMLATSGRGGDVVLTADAEELVSYREPDMVRGYPELRAAVEGVDAEGLGRG
jgi:hypothetical protein